ncbi:MAG TPA: PspC domain-containing protein [Acidimicrobiia bacterium]|nr:PspC domain-containing protein [Acidimicrobiia bacterium]
MESEPQPVRSFELRRRQSNRLIAGVAGGMADTLGVKAGYVRAAFLTLVTVWGIGALIYLVLWIATYERLGDREPEPVSTNQAAGLGMAFLGLLFLMAAAGLWPNAMLVLTAGALSFGIAALTDPSSPGPLAAFIDPDVERVGKSRLVIGVVLLTAGIVVFATAVGQVFEFGFVFLAVFLTGLGILVAFGPWVRKLLSDLSAERSERIRQEERAEVAAHLHDSVLQTLALIQRSDDPRRMAMLARHQETELRDWLYGTVPLAGVDLMSTALKQAASRVEDDFQIPVDVVTVGDHSVDERTRAVISAATEAMVNAAKHAGVDRISLYFEVESDSVEVFVTDQGKGFDVNSISADRKGISESIRSRMEKIGGSAEIVSEPGEGTEVMLKLAP